MHIGYCIGCYGTESFIFSAPISTTKEKMRELLGREWPIGGDPLTEGELLKLREDLLGEFQVGWDSSLSFFVEGMNLPEDDFSW